MSWSVKLQLQLGALSLSVDLEGGNETIALIGPNGSGKTTLLRTIAGAHKPESGYIKVDGHDLFHSEKKLLLPPEERGVGYVPQGFRLFPHMRVDDNVAFGCLTQQPHWSRKQRRQAALELLRDMECAHLAARMPSALSGGEQQRVALARALMIQPKLLLLDEPLSALDATARRTFRAFLSGYLAKQNGPTIIVTHDARDVLSLCEKVCAIDRGSVVQCGSPEEVKEQPANDFVAEFFGVWDR